MLVSNFLRDELRSLLKQNGVSYHKPGKQNLMKSKMEMAEDLRSLMTSANGLRDVTAVGAEEHSQESAPTKKRGVAAFVGDQIDQQAQANQPAKSYKQTPAFHHGQQPEPPPLESSDYFGGNDFQGGTIYNAMGAFRMRDTSVSQLSDFHRILAEV